MPTIIRAKCVVVGDATVGKSSLCQGFHSDGSHFLKNYSMTSGVELLVKSVNIPDSRDSVEMYIHDSAGKEMFSDIVKKFWEHTSMVVVVYDVTSESSFSSCAKWLERVRSQKPNVHMPGALLANKIDLDQRRVISPKIGKEFAAANGLEYFEVSAKEMQNVEACFYYLAGEYHRLYQEKLEQFSCLQ